MRSIEAEAKSKDEAISRALEDLSLNRSQVQVEVLEEGSRGFLGVGGKPVRVRVSELDAGTEGPVAVVRTLLELMGVEFNLVVNKDEETTNVKVEAPKDEGLLIGRRGQTLDAIRHVAQRIIAAKEGRDVVVNIDVGDYRARREEALCERGREAADEVIKEERSVTLEPMSAQDRRVVHLSLADREDLHTYTVGNGARRRVVIAPGARGSRRQSREFGNVVDEGPAPESASAYDAVPDPGFKSSRIESGATETAPPQERRSEESGEDQRPPRQPRRRSRSRGGRDDGNRGEQRSHGSRGGEGNSSRPSNERRDEGSGPRSREGDRDESRSSSSRDEGRGNRRGPRRREERRDDRHGGDRSPSRDEDRPAYDDGGSQEPGAKELSHVAEVTDDSQEKAFPSTLARQILQLEEKKGGEETPAPTGRRRPRRR